MTEHLENLLHLLCSKVQQSQQNAQQTVYQLGDAIEAKLCYDLLSITGIDTKFFSEDHGGKLYVQNASVASSDESLKSALSIAPLFKQMKTLLDQQAHLGEYSLSLSDTPSGRQLTLLLPTPKASVIPKPQTPANTLPVSAKPAQTSAAKRSAAAKDDAELLAGPTVARASIPKSLKASATGEDSLGKRIFLYLSGRAFSSVAWALFIVMILGFIFSFLVTIKGFLCPDVATDARTIPSYCPRPMPRP